MMQIHKLILIGLAILLSHSNLESLDQLFYINSVAWSSDCETIALGYATSYCEVEHPEYYDIELINAQTLQPQATLSGHTCDITSLDWHSDNRRLLSTSIDRSARVWDTTTLSQIMITGIGSQGRYSGRWNPLPMSHEFVTVTYSHSVEVWTDSSDDLRQLLGGAIVGDWSPDGTQIVTGGIDGHLRFRDVTTGETSIHVQEPTDDIDSVDWSPDGTRVASGSSDGYVTIYNTQGHVLSSLQLFSPSVNTLRWSPNSCVLAIADIYGMVLLIDRDGHRLLDFAHFPGFLHDIAWNPNGTPLALVGNSHEGQNDLVIADVVFDDSCHTETIVAFDDESLGS